MSSSPAMGVMSGITDKRRYSRRPALRFPAFSDRLRVGRKCDGEHTTRLVFPTVCQGAAVARACSRVIASATFRPAGPARAGGRRAAPPPAIRRLGRAPVRPGTRPRSPGRPPAAAPSRTARAPRTEVREREPSLAALDSPTLLGVGEQPGELLIRPPPGPDRQPALRVDQRPQVLEEGGRGDRGGRRLPGEQRVDEHERRDTGTRVASAATYRPALLCGTKTRWCPARGSVSPRSRAPRVSPRRRPRSG